MDQEMIFLTILGMGLVTFLPRVLPLLTLTGLSLPKWLIDWLRYVPHAVLAALLLPSILLQDGQISLGLDNLFLWASLPTLGVAIWAKSLFLPVIVGMAIVIFGRWFL